MKRTGLLHLYYGDGKGKTTAAMGLALRAMGSGKRVVILQFLKGGKSGEVPLLEQLGAKVYRGKAGQKFVFQMNEAEKEATRQLQNANLTAAMAAPADLLILDEAGSAWELDMVALHLGHIVRSVQHPLWRSMGSKHAFLLCRAFQHSLLQQGFIHHIQRGISARKGIEY